MRRRRWGTVVLTTRKTFERLKILRQLSLSSRSNISSKLGPRGPEIPCFYPRVLKGSCELSLGPGLITSRAPLTQRESFLTLKLERQELDERANRRAWNQVFEIMTEAPVTYFINQRRRGSTHRGDHPAEDFNLPFWSCTCNEICSDCFASFDAFHVFNLTRNYHRWYHRHSHVCRRILPFDPLYLGEVTADTFFSSSILRFIWNIYFLHQVQKDAVNKISRYISFCVYDSDAFV